MPDASPGLSIDRIVQAQGLSEGAGVHVNRSIGTPALRNLDPFLMLDHFNSLNPGDYIAGFPDHPHRGFITLTYLLEGHMLHWDSLGNRGDLVSGGAQWMKAARGVIHSEMPQQTEGRMSGFQLWINLPAREKMSDPAYQEVLPGEIPIVSDRQATVRVLAGTYNTITGPIRDPVTSLTCLDVSVGGGAPVSLTFSKANDTAFLYAIDGTVSVDGTLLPTEALAVLSRPDHRGAATLTVVPGPDGARFLYVSGTPIREPIAAYGPFVMNTRQEIEQAMDDYRNNRLVS